jgi:hypothetical protein
VWAGLVATALAVSGVSATNVAAAAGVLQPTATPVAAPSAHGHPFNVYALTGQAASIQAASLAQPVPQASKVSAATFRTWKSAATGTPAPRVAAMNSPAASSTTGFAGMADSARICPYFHGCQPPDMALASSPSLILQGVNTSWQLYSPSGRRVTPPIGAQQFFGVPNLPHNCDKHGVFLSDPRAFYDPNTGRMWAAILQVEDAGGIAGGCPFQSRYWIANFNPTSGNGCVYSVDMALGTTNFADYTKFGFSRDTVGWSGDMFNQAGTRFRYEEAMFASKARMQRCQTITPTAFTNFRVEGGRRAVLLDNVQPVETETTAANDPGVLYLANSFNAGPGEGDPFGDNCVSRVCHGFVVWAYAAGGHRISGQVIDSTLPAAGYVLPPNADQPSCQQCVETIDTRITATPVYSTSSGSGLISFAVETAADNGSGMNVPAVLWGQLQPQLTSRRVIGGSLHQSGYIAFSGDRAASFGTTMPGGNGRLLVLFDTMSSTINPGFMTAQRQLGDPLGSLRPPSFVKQGTAPTVNFRWGDFEAASYTGPTDDAIWVASQYSIGDWATWIARR